MSFSIKKFFKSFGLAFVSCITVFSQVSATETVVLEKNQNTPKISVLMPVYNCEQYLRKSLDSVLNQTFKDIELICVNDGSKDNSLEILKEYSNKDSRLVVIDQENQGAALARQNAMKKATGEYIAFVDSDDIIDENAYEIAYDSIQKHDAEYSKAKKIVHIPHTFYNYRVNPNSLMCKASATKVLKNYLGMLKYVKKYYNDHNVKIELRMVLGYLTVYKDEILPLIKTILNY